jgi:CelD/BcsL family acetyltransferase involved in cellulose biosynthesis
VGVPIAAGLTDCQGLIHAPGAKWDALELLRACRLSVWHFDHLVEGQRPFERYRTAIMPSPIIDLTDGFASYYRNLSSRSPQFCRNIERKARKLAREADQLRFVVDSDDTSAFHALIAWKSAQYRRTAHADIFARPWIAGLTEVLFNTRKSDFGGLLSVLYAGDVAVAAHFGLRCAHILAHWIPAYDTSLSGYSPGLIMHMRMAEFTPSAGIGVIDMGTGIHRYKEELKSGDIFVGGGTVTGDSLLAAAHRARGIASQRMITTIKRHPLPYETGKWLRKQYRLARSTHKRSSR